MRRRIAVLALLGAAVAGAYEYISIHKTEKHVPASGPAFITTFRSAPTALDLLLAQSDGQFYAAIAEDPLLRHPERFPNAGEVAYRWQRPVLPYATWILSGGDPTRARTGLAVAVVLSAGAAAAAAGVALERAGRTPFLGLAVLLLPGSLIALRGYGPELMALAAAIAGTLAATRSRPAAASALLCVATLSRESFVLVAVALGLYVAITQRRVRDGAVIVALPAVALGGWWVLVYARIRAWPWDASVDRLAPPWSGLASGIADWTSPLDALFASAGLALVVMAVVRVPSHPMTWIAAGTVPFALVMGWDVWRTWESFGRPLLPLYAFGALALADRPLQRAGET